MSNFLSQIEINPQVGNDDAEIEKEDLEREKEIKDFLENELDDDDLFDDESSFASRQTPMSHLQSPAESLYEYQEFPNQRPSQSSNHTTGPLLTSRGSDFLKKTGSKSSPVKQSYENRDQMEYLSNPYEYETRISKDQSDCLMQEYHPGGSNSYNMEGGSASRNTRKSSDWNYDDYPTHDDVDKIEWQSRQRRSDQSSFPSSNERSLETRQISGDFSAQNSEYLPDSFRQHFSANKESFRGSLEHNDQNSYTTRVVYKNMNEKTDSQSKAQNPLLGSDNSDVCDDKHVRDVNQSSEYPFPTVRQHASMFPFESQREFVPIQQYDTDHNDNEFVPVSEHAQLRILYEARGRKIEELQRSSEERMEEHDKNMRILQHKFTMMTGERDGLKVSHEQSMDLLREAKNQTEEFEKLLSEERERNEKLKRNQRELIEKLEMSESTIDSLNQQLTALNQADSLSRMRSQHETIMATLRQKHEEDMLYLKEKLDDTKKELNWKLEDVGRLQDELQFARKMTDHAKIEAAETVNKLTKSLEQSQRQCREILEEGAVNEVGEMKYELKHVIKEKTELEEKYREMKEELRDAKEQLNMYEAALDSSTKGPISSTPLNAPRVEMKWPSHEYVKTPLSRFQNQHGGHESPVYSLRDELIKALSNNRAKREELHNAKAKADIFEHQLEAAHQDMSRLKIENETLKAKITKAEAQNEDESRDSAKEDENQKEILQLKEELNACEEKIIRLEDKCKEKQEENSRLKGEVSELMQVFDKDKLEAIKSCEKTYLQFNTDSKEALEQKLKEIHNQEIAALREEMRQLSMELMDVKESYVSIASENKALEKQVRLECEREAEAHLKEMKASLEQVHKEEITKLEEEHLSKNYADLEVERKKLQSGFEEEAKHRIETAIALAKVDWFAAYEEEKSASINRAVENAKVKWIKDKDHQEFDIQEMFKQLKEEWENAKQDEFDQRLTSAVKLAKAEWQDATRRDTSKAVERATDECNRKNQVSKQKEIEQAVIDAKNNWERDAKRMRDTLNETLKKVEELESEIDEYKVEVARLKEEARQKESEFQESIKDINGKKEKDIEFIMARAQVDCDKEKDILRQQILQEECEKIRLELLASFAETKENDLQEMISKERDQPHEAVDRDRLTELKDTITLIKESYRRRIDEQSLKLREDFKQEKSEILKSLNEKLRTEICKIEENFESKHQERLQSELDKHKNEWKAELQSLQNEHVGAMQNTVNEIKNKNDKCTETLKKNFNDYVRKMKRENSEKLEKQKLDLESYHGNLTKRTLELARKEWELEASFRGKPYPSGKSKRAFSESHNTIHQSYSKLAQDTGFQTANLESSDSGFTSPFARITQVSKASQDGRKDIAELLEASQGQSPPYEILLDKLEADILHLKDKKNSPRDVFAGHEKSTQTEGKGQNNEAVLEDMRKYYLETVRKINEDVLKHITKTKENAAACLRKEVLKEKKGLISKIRKSSMKHFKETVGKESTDAKRMAIFAALKEVECEDASHTKTPNEPNVQLSSKQKDPRLTIEIPNNDTTNQFKKPSNMPAPSLSPILSSPISKRQSKVPVPVHHKPATRRDSSPSNSMFSCESNGTFYTELPPSHNTTPVNDTRASKLSILSKQHVKD